MWPCQWVVCSQPCSGDTDAHAWVPGLSPKLGKVVPAAHTCNLAVHVHTQVHAVGVQRYVCQAHASECTGTDSPLSVLQAPSRSFLNLVSCSQKENLKDVVGKEK